MEVDTTSQLANLGGSSSTLGAGVPPQAQSPSPSSSSGAVSVSSPSPQPLQQEYGQKPTGEAAAVDKKQEAEKGGNGSGSSVSSSSRKNCDEALAAMTITIDRTPPARIPKKSKEGPRKVERPDRLTGLRNQSGMSFDLALM
jgi:hypothetical protein